MRKTFKPFVLKPSAAAILCAIQALLPHAAGAQVVLPTGMAVIHGQASATTTGAAMQITTGSDRTVLNWQGFSIGAGSSVNIQQPGAASQVLNRVTGQDPSAILGSLGSNGQVWLLNPNGVLFGKDARIDVGGVVASTLRMDTADFLAGRLRLRADAADAGAAVVNQGAIRSSYGGSVYLVGADVRNSGSIDAPGGNVALLAASQVDLVDSGTPYLTLRVPVSAGLVQQDGSVHAGRIDLHGAVVNQNGLLDADSLQQDGSGRIVLRASDAVNLLAGSRTVAPGGSISVGGDPALGETLASRVTVERGATVDASASAVGDGGRIVLWSQDMTAVSGTLRATGGTTAGNGGFIETSGQKGLQVDQAADASAPHGLAGTWLLDPHDITIQATGPDSNVAGSPDFTSTADSAVVSTGSIVAALNAGTNVSITTSAGGSQQGNITVADAIVAAPPTGSTHTSLTLNAAHDISINADIRTTAGPLDLALNPNQAMDGGVAQLQSARIGLGDGTLTLNGQLNNNGTLSLAGGILGTGLIQNEGVVELAGGSIQANIANLAGGSMAIGGATDFFGTVTNQGAIDIAGNSAVGFHAGYNQGGGSMTIGTATTGAVVGVPVAPAPVALLALVPGGIAPRSAVAVAPAPSTDFIINGGTLSANGTLAANVIVNGGTFKTNATGNVVTVTGSLSLGPAATLAVGIGGTNPGVDYDRFVVTGNAALDGNLLLTQQNGFTPVAGNSFTFLSANTLSGSFATVSTPAPVNAWNLVVSVTPNSALAVAGAVVAPAPAPAPAPTPAPTPTPSAAPASPAAAPATITASLSAPPVVGTVWSDLRQARQAARDDQIPPAPAPTPIVSSKAYEVQGASTAILDAVVSDGYRFLSPEGTGGSFFRVLPVAQMSLPDLGELLQSRTGYKKALFADAIEQLEQKPGLSDVPACDGGAGAAAGTCLLSPAAPTPGEAKTRDHDTRRPAKRIAVLFGLDRYQDKRIPQLTNPVSDVTAVGSLLASKLGYETRVIANAGKAEVIAQLNRLVQETEPNDSVVVYFAGHGEMVEKTGLGYWIPSDADAGKPQGWISNTDVSRALSHARSKQIAVVADSCYSGVFAREAVIGETVGATSLADYESRRAVTVMSSGGDEPVADGGKQGHSVFAWNLMQQLDGIDGWLPGAKVFAQVRNGVERELPQSPMYGASLAAGHEAGADFLFQRPGSQP